jgi:predicted flap endonuclease-1-like 5' DNA nuclease
MLGMAHIRALEVATFYFMFQLAPVGSVAHIQICGTTSCMICGAEDLVGVCKDKIAPKPHQLSADGKFSWEEVECLGACANAPMAQIGKDYYEDLTAEKLAALIDEMAAGKVPTPGPQNGRYASEPAGGLTSPGLERALNDMGIHHFSQIASWSPAEVAWVDQNLVQFKGRASRDDWVDQAKLLASGGETEFSRRVDKGDVYD